MIFIAGIAIALLLQLLLITKKEKSTSDRILFFWMFLISMHLFIYFLVFSESYLKFPHILGIELNFPFFYGVFLYFYTASVTAQLPKKRVLLLLHLIPITLFYLIQIPFFSLSGAEKILVYQNEGAGFEQSIAFRSTMIVVINLIYIIWSLILLRRHQVNIQNQFSAIEKISLQWLRVLIIGTGGVLLLAIFFSDVYVFSGIAAFVFLISFFGIKQQSIFSGINPQLATNSLVEKKKYAKSGLTDEASDDIYQRLRTLMEGEQIYKKEEISIQDLANKLGVNPNYLSQVINEREGRNYYDFINNLRLEEFKRLVAIPKNQNLTILSLAYDSGFSSKTSFNRYFKKVMDQTPSQYLAKIVS